VAAQPAAAAATDQLAAAVAPGAEVAGVTAAGIPALTAAAGAAAAPAETSPASAEAAAPAAEVAGVQAAAPLAAALSNVGGVVASVLPSTGEPAALFGIALLGLAGAGLFMRRLGRPR
jgi:hypothetical protein